MVEKWGFDVGDWRRRTSPSYRRGHLEGDNARSKQIFILNFHGLRQRGGLHPGQSLVHILGTLTGVPSVVLPVCIGLYWWANTYQSIHDVLECIRFVFEVRWFVLRTTMVGFALQYILNTIQIQTVDSEIRSYWTSNTNTILTNTEMGRTIQTKTWFNPIQSVPIQSNTHQYIVNGLVCIEYKPFVFNTYCLYSIGIAVNPYLF